MARSGRHPGQGLEHDATHEDHEGGGHAEDGEECEEDLAVAGRGELCVQLVEAEADPHDSAHQVVIAVAALAFLEVPQGLKERQHAAAVESLFGLLWGDGLHRAGEQRVADPRAGLPSHLRDALDEARVEAREAVHRIHGFEVAERLDAVPAVDLEPADVLEFGLQFLYEPADNVRSPFEHPVLDAPDDSRRQEAGSLLVPGNGQLRVPSNVMARQDAEPQDEDGEDQRDNLDLQPPAEEVGKGHTVSHPAEVRGRYQRGSARVKANLATAGGRSSWPARAWRSALRAGSLDHLVRPE